MSRALSPQSLLKQERAQAFLDAKQFPGLVGFHHDLRKTQIVISKKPDSHKEVALKRKNSLTGDVSLHSIFDPNLTKSELKNINYLKQFKSDALLRHAPSYPTLESMKIKTKYPKHKSGFKLTNRMSAKKGMAMKDPFTRNHKTLDAVREEQLRVRKEYNSKILGPRTMSYGQLQDAPSTIKRDQYMNISSVKKKSGSIAFRNNSEVLRYHNTIRSAKNRIDDFMYKHKKIMKQKQFGKVKRGPPPLSKRRQLFNASMQNLLLTSSRSSLAQKTGSFQPSHSMQNLSHSKQDITFDLL